MKTKLLKRLRKEARDTFRIAPSVQGTWKIERREEGGFWIGSIWLRYIDVIPSLDEAVEALNKERESEFKKNANYLIRQRDYKRRMKLVKGL